MEWLVALALAVFVAGLCLVVREAASSHHATPEDQSRKR
jgi:hypothetical protein